MADATFPPSMAIRQDSRFYDRGQTDDTVKGSTGGYLHTRARFTRRALRTFATGFTDISQAELKVMEDFYEEVGQHTVFNWTDPTTAVVYEMRIAEMPKAQYAGAGGNHRYNLGPIQLLEK